MDWRVYKTDGWPTTLMLVNAIGFVAEAGYHHPDLSVTWGRVTVKLKTHSAGGITDKDFALAQQIEDVALWREARVARSRERRTSLCEAATRADDDRRHPRRSTPSAVRHRASGRTGAPSHDCRNGPTVRFATLQP